MYIKITVIADIIREKKNHISKMLLHFSGPNRLQCSIMVTQNKLL